MCLLFYVYLRCILILLHNFTLDSICICICICVRKIYLTQKIVMNNICLFIDKSVFLCYINCIVMMNCVILRIEVNIFMAGGKKSDVGELQHRLTLRLSQTDYEKLAHWAQKKEMSINEFVPVLLEQYIDIYNGNYQLPSLEVQRLNQLIESQAVLSRNIQALESIIVNGFDSLLSLTKGDNYLMEDEDGEL